MKLFIATAASVFAIACAQNTGLAPAASAQTAAASADEVVAAERAFAARHQDEPVKVAFAATAAQDGVLLSPDGVQNAQEFIATWPDRDNAGLIVWYPDLAGISSSGDLGFTTGPAIYGGGAQYGTYLTVWKSQADGSWRWMIDQGAGREIEPTGDPAADPVIVPMADVPAMDQAAAWQALVSSEQALNQGLAADSQALAGSLDPMARLMGFESDPVTGEAAWRAALAERPATYTPSHEGGGVSEAGDLGWTYGLLRYDDAESGEEKSGGYLRIWRRTADGWRIIIDNSQAFG